MWPWWKKSSRLFWRKRTWKNENSTYFMFPRPQMTLRTKKRKWPLKKERNCLPGVSDPDKKTIWRGLPRLAMNLVISIAYAWVSSPFTTSMWTAPVTKDVNKQHQCLTGLRKPATLNGPEKSTSKILDGNTLSCTRSFRRAAIWGWIGCTATFLHLLHLDLKLSNAFRSPITQNLCWTMLLTYSVPSWWLSSCNSLISRTTAGCLAESGIGSSKSSLIVALLNRPFNRNVLSLSINGKNLAKLCLTLSSVVFKFVEQFGKAFTLSRLQNIYLELLSF